MTSVDVLMPNEAFLALVLTASPGSGALDDALLREVLRALGNATERDRRILAPREAAEIAIERGSSSEFAEVRDEIADVIGNRPIDINYVAGRLGRRVKRLLIADMDSTIIRQECIDEMADLKGIKPEVAAVTERAMRGELDFESALKARLALLDGIGEAELEALWRERIELMPGARTLIATMNAAGAFTALVSGGFTFFTSRVAKAVGFQVNHANELEMAAGRMTGRVVEPILGREAKLATLERYRAERGLLPADTLAVGDGANDLAMIRAAGLGIAYRAKPIVAAEAAAAITHGDLTALLYLQGVTREEFAAA